MQGLADGYFIIPYTIGGYLAGNTLKPVQPDQAAFTDVSRDVEHRINKLMNNKGSRTVDDIHRELGKLMWDNCGMARTKESLQKVRDEVPKLREAFWNDVNVTGSEGELNQVLERAGRVADFLEFAETMALDAQTRNESCGGHFREEYQTEEGEALRDDENFCHVAAWEFNGVDKPPTLHKEKLEFDYVKPSTRSYK